MPLGDWQFWVVTLLGLGGLYLVIRPFLPRKKKGDGCPTCASGSAAMKKKRPRRVSLTVENKHVS